jgi:hypothetical protein
MRKRALERTWILAPTLGLFLSTSAPAQQDRGQLPPHERALAPGELLPVDRSFFQVAAATGGDFYFWTPGEFARADLHVPLGGEAVLLSYGESDGKPQSFELPIDALSGRLELFVGAQRLDGLRLIRPSGFELTDDPATCWQRYERMRIVSVELPEPGTWRVEFTGRSLYALSARVAAGRIRSPRRTSSRSSASTSASSPRRVFEHGGFPLKRRVRPATRDSSRSC